MVTEENLGAGITNCDIDIFMQMALDSIKYWCLYSKVVGKKLGKYSWEQISRGGSIELYDYQERKSYVLNKEKLLCGLGKYYATSECGDLLDCRGRGLRVITENMDVEVSDAIIQYALFDEIIYE